jgi:KDO2-lipid IV(A) lauroyltransferase
MQRRSRAREFKNWAIYRTLTAASAAGRSLSLPAARRIGRSIGRLAYRTVGRERERALRHLAIAFPEMPLSERQRITAKMFEHLGMALLEICWLPNLDRETMAKTTRFVGLENLQKAIDSGDGVMAFTGHCGNWEWMASCVALSGFDLSVVAREIYDPRMNEFIVRSRALHGVKTIGRGSSSSARDLLQALRRGGILGMLIDQDIKAESADVPFFGRLASTPVGPARLAIRSGAQVMTLFTWRDGDMQVIEFGDPSPTTRTDDPVALTAHLTKLIEMQIRRVPEQWVWMHRRWGKNVT